MPLLRPTSPAPLSPRLHRRAVALASIGGIALGALLSACSDSPVGPRATPATAAAPALAPSATPDQGLLSTVTSTLLSTVNGLLWVVPVTSATATAVIGPEGGSFSIPNGIRVTVPRGAVSSRTTFSVTRQPGLIVAYDFQPHGTTFAVPLTIEQPSQGTNLLKLLPTAKVQAAYYSGTSALDQLLGIARVSEFRPTVVSSDRSLITFTVSHFSGYMVSTGREE